MHRHGNTSCSRRQANKNGFASLPRKGSGLNLKCSLGALDKAPKTIFRAKNRSPLFDEIDGDDDNLAVPHKSFRVLAHKHTLSASRVVQYSLISELFGA